MVNYTILTRPAMAMIELILAIVVMGIVLMSAPMLISQANKSVYTSTQQEGISAAASHMSLVLSRPWDANNVPDDQQVILNTAGTGSLANLNLGYRAGTSTTGSHRTFLNAESNITFNASNIGQENGVSDFDDIDDYNNSTITLTRVERNDIGDYIDSNLTIGTVVGYVSDVPEETDYNTTHTTLNFNTPFDVNTSVSTTSVKHVQITLTQGNNTPDELNKTIILHAFSCNIGAYRLEEKTF